MKLIFKHVYSRYDCNEHILGVVDYCVHFMSKYPTITPEKVIIFKNQAVLHKSIL